MATFEQRKSGWWQAKIRRKGHPPQSKTFQFKVDAEAWARDIENKMDRGIFVDRSEAEQTTVGQLIDRFKKEFAPFHYRRRDDKKEAWRFQIARLKDELGDYSLAVLDQRLVAKYRDTRLKGKGDDRPAVGEGTVRKELYMLSKVLDFAQTECGIVLPRGNPVDKIRKPTDSKARDRRLTEKEWAAVEAECKASRNVYLWPAVQLAVETTMRQGELLALTWKHVNLKRRLAHLPKTKNGEARSVPLSPRAVAVLEALPRSISGEVIPVQRMTLYHVFAAAIKRADVSDFTFHDLRHEGLSRLAERGDFSVLELAAVSGHKTLQMLKRYTHLQAEKLADKLANPHL
jgi:integrase